MILAAAAAGGALWYGGAARGGAGGGGATVTLPVVLGGAVTQAATQGAVAITFGGIAWVFFKVGATLFGSGYVLVSYLQSALVDDYAWLTQRQLLDAVAVGQFTPGPLLTTATFIGFVLGHSRFGGGAAGGLVGAVVATVSIFLPSFLFVAVFGPMLQRVRRNPLARGALDGMNAAVVGLMIVITLRLAGAALLKESRQIDWLNLAVLLASAVALLRWKVNATWIVLAAAVVGLLL